MGILTRFAEHNTHTKHAHILNCDIFTKSGVDYKGNSSRLPTRPTQTLMVFFLRSRLVYPLSFFFYSMRTSGRE